MVVKALTRLLVPSSCVDERASKTLTIEALILSVFEFGLHYVICTLGENLLWKEMGVCSAHNTSFDLH